MLELPESIVIAKQLEHEIKNTTITNVTAAATPHKFAFYQDNPADYPAMLTGETVTGIKPMGGYIEIQLKKHNIILGEDLILHYLSQDDKSPVRHQLLLEFDNGYKFAATVKMFGALYVALSGHYTVTHHQIAHDKPNPLTAAFNDAYFESLAQNLRPAMSLKAFLATEQRIPGLGNGVLQDILFNAGLNPKTKLKQLSADQMHKLYDSIKTTLAVMAKLGGRNTEKDLYGNWGGYETILSANTLENPCPKCGSPITKQAYMGGNVYFCPVCQPL